MATPVIMPRQGQSVESCILTEWKVQSGDTVAEGDVLAVIETDKASFDLESTASGTVLELFWEADDDVPVLANVLVIGEEGENIDESKKSIALNVTIQSSEKTLNEEDLNKINQLIIKTVESKTDAKIRS